jgi:hypothetical protein
MLRRIAVILALATVVGLSAGCQPEPAPTPTAPVFASEDEAFAAAEETYRAYVDALNQVDLSDPETFEGVYEWTTGEANAGARKTFTQMHADGWVVDGPTVIDLVEPSTEQPEDESVSLDICLNVRQVTLVDEQGESVVAPDRRDVQSMRADLLPSTRTSTGFAISLLDGREGEPECAA